VKIVVRGESYFSLEVGRSFGYVTNLTIRMKSRKRKETGRHDEIKEGIYSIPCSNELQPCR
jgi:hypothetical protein